MGGLFAALNRAVEGTPLVAVAGSLAWGVLSVVLSPCHLASIPLVVGYINRQGEPTVRRAFAISSVFSLGILVTIGIVGAITAVAGRMLGDVGPYGNYIVAAVFFLVGLYLLDVIPLPWRGLGNLRMGSRGYGGAVLLGLVFGVALGPCTFAYMAPMLAVTFGLASHSLPYAGLLLGMYALGHCAVIVAAGTSIGMVQRYLRWSERSRGTRIVKGVSGALVLLAGLYLVYTAP
ncbi:cytochrome C biogenesis protein [Candidatus Bipolaricaulota bacterium]|nr:cytochrome C biogenesis protein [Candidatus Bipolaricaulota bacterium]